MSVVDRGGWVSAGRARRLLVRVLLVLGGALAVTGVGWLIGTATASAEVLPTVPMPPLSAVTDVVHTPSVPTPALPTTLPAPASLGQVEQQVHQAVSGVGDRVTPATVPALPVTVPLGIIVTEPASHTPTVTDIAGATPVTTAALAGVRPQTVLSHRHSVSTVAHVRPRTTDTAPVGAPQRHAPALPPAGSSESSDANVHTMGGSAGGAGGAQLPFVTLVGAAPHPVGRPTTPRLPVAPGRQPGTSPD